MIRWFLELYESQIPRSKLTGHQISGVASCGVFGLHSVPVVAKQVPLALSNPRGSRQMDIEKHVHLARCFAEITYICGGGIFYQAGQENGKRHFGRHREDNMNRILIIDDDRELCTLIKKSVLAENIEADGCSSGKTGLAMLREKDYQLVILDVMMPGMDGFETLEQIREESSVPVLMFTAKNDSVSKVRGLRAGADDYLTKPFDMDELIARIVSLIRRYTMLNQKGEGPAFFQFDGLTIDKDTRSITTVNGSFELPPKEFGLLMFLAENQGKIVTKKQIYENVWGEEYFYDDSNIMAVISRLRKKMEENPGNPKYIQTIKGIGYRLCKGV